MKKSKILDDLYSLQRFGIKPGLERTLHLLEKAGNPHRKLRCIHVAGTNGKGTTCGIITSILMEYGFKTALYTSPHIADFNERIRINGEKISDYELASLAEEFLDYGRDVSATFFEITTAIALKYFSMNSPDYCVIETGMGGRFDSTNVIAPIVSVITDIGLEHTQYLGNTIDKIAFEKAGIIKPNIPLVCNASNLTAMNVFATICKERNSGLIIPKNIYHVTNIVFNPDFTMTLELEAQNKLYRLTSPYAGDHQCSNIITAITALDQLGFDEEDKIQQGLTNAIANTGTIGRIQMLRDDPYLIIDSAHNPDALKKLADTIVKCTGSTMKWSVLFAAMKDKDIEKMLEAIFPITDELIITKPDNVRASSPQDIAFIAKKIGFKEIIILPKPEPAFVQLINGCKPSIVCGSFFLLGDLSKYFHL